MKKGDLVGTKYDNKMIGIIIEIIPNGFAEVDWLDNGNLLESIDALRKPTQIELRERKLKRILGD